MDLLMSIPLVNHFRHSQPQPQVIFENFRRLLENFRPTAVHFHHYVHLGLEFIREVRKFSPDVAIVVTLHEFLAICNAQGQMLKTNGLLCNRAAPIDCHRCFPGTSPQEFFMRELFVKSFFELVDQFVCPSKFLCERYIEWGLPREKTMVLDNGQPRRDAEQDPTGDQAREQATELAEGEDVGCRFAVLGQLSRLKGTLVLLEAIRLLPKSVRRKIKVEIHGTVQHALEDFKLELSRALEGLEETVRLCGPYRPEHVLNILRRNGWLIVPSIWWENSPVVIQEAFAAGRPVICSNIGGMAEKVQNGVNGLHFRVSNPADLASRLEQIVLQPELWNGLRLGVARPFSVEQAVDSLISLYECRRVSSPALQSAL
jgi:glycosyltransferase involved in cell wall biosynthesis